MVRRGIDLKRWIAAGFLVIVSLGLLSFGQASATSWVDIPPEEIVERADAVITGRYDFQSEGTGGPFNFIGHEFVVEKVYKGDASEQLTVGIDAYDVNWAQEFQSEGGTFLLFLEETDEMPYLTPIGGPNGMIQLMGNRVEIHDDAEEAYFQAYLDGQDGVPATPSTSDASVKTGNERLWLILLLLLSGSTVLLFGYRIIRMRTRE
jgi:hypothetical protein